LVVEIDATALPLCVFVGLIRRRQQGLTIELFEELTAAASRDLIVDRIVELAKDGVYDIEELASRTLISLERAT
jgi:hypothetical protein